MQNWRPVPLYSSSLVTVAPVTGSRKGGATCAVKGGKSCLRPSNKGVTGGKKGRSALNGSAHRADDALLSAPGKGTLLQACVSGSAVKVNVVVLGAQMVPCVSKSAKSKNIKG